MDDKVFGAVNRAAKSSTAEALDQSKAPMVDFMEQRAEAKYYKRCAEERRSGLGRRMRPLRARGRARRSRMCFFRFLRESRLALSCAIRALPHSRRSRSVKAAPLGHVSVGGGFQTLPERAHAPGFSYGAPSGKDAALSAKDVIFQLATMDPRDAAKGEELYIKSHGLIPPGTAREGWVRERGRARESECKRDTNRSKAHPIGGAGGRYAAYRSARPP